RVHDPRGRRARVLQRHAARGVPPRGRRPGVERLDGVPPHPPHVTLDDADVVERYLLVGLQLGVLHAELVDAYYGPSELRERAAAEPGITPASIGARIDRLIADLDGGAGAELGDQRRRW